MTPTVLREEAPVRQAEACAQRINASHFLSRASDLPVECQ